MDVVDLGGILSVTRLVTPLVALTVADAALDPAAAQPVSETVGVVVAALASLARRHPAEFGGPEDDGVFKEPALFEVLDESRATARHTDRERPMVSADVLVRVPVAPRESVVVAAPDLNESNAAFEQPARGEAFLREIKALFFVVDVFRPGLRPAVKPVQLHDMLRLGLEV